MARTNLMGILSHAPSRFAGLVVFAMLVLPFGWQPLTTTALVLILLHTLVSCKPAHYRGALANPVFWLPAMFYLYQVITLFWSENSSSAGAQLETKFTLLAAPFVLAANAWLVGEGLRQKLLRAFVGGNVAVLTAAFAVAVWRSLAAGSAHYVPAGGTEPVSIFTYKGLSAPFMHPGYLSTYIGIALIIGLYYFLEAPKGKKWGWMAVLAYLFAGLMMLQGRISLLALFVVLLVGSLVFAYAKKACVWLLAPAVPLLLFTVFVAFGGYTLKARFLRFPNFNYRIQGEAKDFNSDTFRLAGWTCAMDVVRENLLFGVGVGDKTNALLAAYEERGFYEGLRRRFNAHNQFMETTISGGLVGLCFLIAMLAGYAIMAFRKGDYLLLATLAFFMLCMLTESMLERAWAVILYAVFFPLALLLPPKGATKSTA